MKAAFSKPTCTPTAPFPTGRLTPAQMKSLYQTGGYSIIAFTDHNVLQWHKELDAPDFLALCGYEVDVCETAPDGYSRCCHLCAISRDPEHAVLIPRPDGLFPRGHQRHHPRPARGGFYRALQPSLLVGGGAGELPAIRRADRLRDLQPRAARWPLATGTTAPIMPPC